MSPFGSIVVGALSTVAFSKGYVADFTHNTCRIHSLFIAHVACCWDRYPPCPGDVNCVVDIAVHDDGKYIAVVTVSGSVTVFSADFAQTFVHIELRAVTPPVSAAWFGRQFESHATLAVAWSQPPVMMLLDMASGVRWIPIESNFIVVPEIDGMRVINKNRCFFLQVSPPVILSLKI